MKSFLKILLTTSLLLFANPAFSQEAEKPEAVKAAPTELEKLSLANTEVEERAAQFIEQVENAPDKLAKISKQLEEPASAQQEISGAGLALKETENKLAEAGALLKSEEAKLQALEDQEKLRTQREAQIPDELAAARTALVELEGSLAAEEGKNSELQKAQQSLLKSRISALEAELSSFTPSGELLSLKKRLATREINTLRKAKERWQEIYDKKYAEETAASTRLAAEQAKRFSNVPQLASLSKANAELAANRSRIREKLKKVTDYETQIVDMRREVRDQREAAVERLNLLEASGLQVDTKNGQLLRSQRAELPTAEILNQALQKNLLASTNARVERLEVKQDYERIPTDRSEELERIFTDLGTSEITRAEVSRLLDQKYELTRELLNDYGVYISKLKETNAATQQVISEVETYSRYLDERLLWIPSAPVISVRDLKVESQSIGNLLGAQFFKKWLPAIGRDALSQILLWLLVSALVVILILKKKWLKSHLTIWAKEARQSRCTSITPTLKAIAASIALAAPVALIVGFLAWRGEAVPAISHGFGYCAGFLGLVGFFKTIVRPDGVLPTHFGLEKGRAALLHRHLRWILPVMPALLFLFTALQFDHLYPESGRLVFIVLMIVGAVSSHLILRPSKCLIGRKGEKNLKAKVFYAIGMILPVLFTIGFCLGYITSVRTLRLQAAESIWLVLLGLFIGAFFLRWTLLSRRRLARDHAAKKFQAAADERKRKSGENDPAVAKDQTRLEELEAEAMKIAGVEEQTSKLVRVGVMVFIAFGLWNVWSSTLPALSILDKVTLWSADAKTEVVGSSPAAVTDITATLTGSSPENSSETAAAPEAEAKKRLSLQDVLASLLAIGLTLIAARNLPGLLELTLLRRLSLKSGGNFAVTTTLRYGILAIGFLIAFGIIGITWSSVQWLAAAVTLGIGFGLQEIFANFVAGIILLYERPIRVGDVVTVGNETGKVTDIQIRATTLLQFNSRELIVPNKQFITGELMNWTLTSSQQRFDFLVGIGYDSDEEKALEILKEIVGAHKDVFKDPAPSVFFVDFGPSSLDFEVKGFVANPDFLLPVKNDLRFEIRRRFKAANIEIAFPQTDIHIRTLPENQEKLSQEPTNA